MSIRKRFNQLFGLQDDIEEERKRFVQRVNLLIFHAIATAQRDAFDYDALFEAVCYELGVNADNLPTHLSGLHRDATPDLVVLTDEDFTKTLQVLCALHAYIQWGRDRAKGREVLSTMIDNVLSRCTCDIGVKWKDGLFYPTGIQELGKPLIEDVLTWLKDYPSQGKDYGAALRHYIAGDSLIDVVTRCYSAVEGITQNILGNKKNLDNNKDALLAQIGLSEGWNRLLGSYINYAHDYRHARSEQRHDITTQEAEAYLYMTGLIIRLAIESKKRGGQPPIIVSAH